jgi:hypothetical protein
VVVSWNGTFELVDLEWDLDGTFASLVGSLADSSLNEHTITGLTAATAYHFRLLPKTTAYGGTTSEVISATTQSTPTISSFTTSLIKPTSVVVSWAGTDYSVVDVKWGLTDGSRRTPERRRISVTYRATPQRGLAVDPVLFRDNAEESVGYGSGTFSGDAVGSTATTTYDPSVAAIDASAVDISVLVGGRELTELWMSCITRRDFHGVV